MYNPYFPSNYPQAYQQNLQSYQQPAPSVQATTSSINWVQGEAGAKAFSMGPAQSVILMDSESNTFYIKSTDVSGMPMPLRIFDFKERLQNVPQTEKTEIAPQLDLSNFITKEEFERSKAELLERFKSEFATQYFEKSNGSAQKGK